MGTRNLTCIIYGGKTRMAKYGQWDGYLNSLGAGILKFLQTDFKPEVFVENLEKVKILTDAEVEATDEKDWVKDGKHWFLTRDCAGYEALAGIQSGKMKETMLNEEFAYESLFNEFTYVLDLDKYVFEVYKGFNKKKLSKTERFYKDKPDSDGYYGVKLLVSYPFDKLPKDIAEVEKLLPKDE